MDIAFNDAIVRVVDALESEGLEVIARIDMHKAFRETLEQEFRHYTILGACNPKLAREALSGCTELGLVLPCNVCVEETGIGSKVYIVDPASMLPAMELDSQTGLRVLGRDAGVRLARVAASLTRFG